MLAIPLPRGCRADLWVSGCGGTSRSFAGVTRKGAPPSLTAARSCRPGGLHRVPGDYDGGAGGSCTTPAIPRLRRDRSKVFSTNNKTFTATSDARRSLGSSSSSSRADKRRRNFVVARCSVSNGRALLLSPSPSQSSWTSTAPRPNVIGSSSSRRDAAAAVASRPRRSPRVTRTSAVGDTPGDSRRNQPDRERDASFLPVFPSTLAAAAQQVGVGATVAFGGLVFAISFATLVFSGPDAPEGGDS